MSVSGQLLPLSVTARYGIAKFFPLKSQRALYCPAASDVNSKLQQAGRCVPRMQKKLTNFRFSIQASENIV
jgi:hypothetical protein